MRKAAIADKAPVENAVTAYDEAHFSLYLQILDAITARASVADMCRTILGCDPDNDPRCVAALESHVARARWMSERGYKDLLASRQ